MTTSSPLQPTTLQQAKLLGTLTILLVLCFAWPLYDLVRFAIPDLLFSHILLIPFISLYLVWLKKDSLPPATPPARSLALAVFTAGMAVLGVYWFASNSGIWAASQDHLTWTTLSLYLLFVGICFFCLGRETLRTLVFPLGFLIFLVPFPHFLIDWIESFLQHASALSAHILFIATGMTFIRDGLRFQLPGITLQVAPECSGIHSTLVLFITSLVAGQLFLVSRWKRAAFALAVIPLGILRNGFRIVTIGQLCVHVGPEMINSPIHHRGGPLFFAVSLVPLFLLLYFLRRSDAAQIRSPHDNKQITPPSPLPKGRGLG